MNIEIDKNEFEKHLNNISSALNTNSPLHSLQGIKITATGNSIELIASNGNLSIKEEVPTSLKIKVNKPGVILVPGKLFKDVIKKQEDEVKIICVDEMIEIVSSGIKTNINLLDHTEYPIINFEPEGKELPIKVSELKKIIKNVSFAAGENDKRIILNGVNLKAKDKVLTASATNSFRLAQEKIYIDSNIEFNITIISRNLRNFIPTNASGELMISVNDSKIITKYENTTIASKLIDGVYPQIDKLIPNNIESEITIDLKEINSLIDKAVVVADESNKVIKLTVNKEELVIESKRDEVGSTIVSSTNFKYDSDFFEIPFNYHFFKEALSKFNGGEVKIQFTGPQRPFIIKSEDMPSLTLLVLPHRTY